MNLWALHFDKKFAHTLGLEAYDPFLSKDCDIVVNYDTFKHFETMPGELNKSESPADGQLAIYTMPGEQELKIDLMTMHYGIPMYELPRAIKRARKIKNITVLDPIYLLKAKCHNLIGIPQGGRQDGKHVGMLTCILPAYFRDLITKAESGEITERQLIKEMKFLLDLCTKDDVVSRALEVTGTTIRELLPMPQLEETSLEKIRTFVASPSIPLQE
ncbi:hypothetical protein OAF27_01215 [Verrucomicrobiales bacterium]|nr:hypothetical protein [Verrucomicrobiales bacterium]